MSYTVANRDNKQLRRDVRGVVLCVVAFIVTLQVVSSVVAVMAAFATHFDLIMAEIDAQGTIQLSGAFSDDLYRTILDTATNEYAGLGSIVGMLCGLPWFFLIRGKKFLTKDVSRVNSKAKFVPLLCMLVFMFGVQGFMSCIQIVLDVLFSQGGNAFTDSLDESTTTLATSLWGVIYIVILGPICEELVFRGAVMRTLERYGANFAIIVSSLLFGLYHMILFQSVFAFLVGLIFAYTAGRFSLKWAIGLHMINNGIAVLTIALNSVSFNFVMSFVFLAALIVSIVILFFSSRQLSAQKAAGAPSEPRVYARAFRSPWLIIYMTLCILAGILLLSIF